MTTTEHIRKDGTTATIEWKDGVATDERNNRASLGWFGTKEKAIESLLTLSDCSDCRGCSGEKDAEKGFGEVPKIDNIHQVLLEAVSKEGALNMDDWHSCETTHCRAGWVVHLAGEAGYALEKKTSPLFAAMQIYKASGYQISPCRFFDGNQEVMEDMRRLAKGEGE